MLHDIEQIRSLISFIKEHPNRQITQDERFNMWMQNNTFSIQDAETVEYYMALIPMIERRFNSK